MKQLMCDFTSIESEMIEISSLLCISNAIKLQFDKSKAATIDCTNLLYVDNQKNNQIKVSSKDNVYFIFDKNFKCCYVGKKDSRGINYRLKLHLVSNQTHKNISPTYSCINEVCNYINSGDDTLFLITLCIKQNYMVEAVESYFIDYFRNKSEAIWVKRK